MTVDLLHMCVNALGNCMGHQVGDVTAELGADAHQRILGGVDDGIVSADAGQEVLDTLG